MIRSHRRTSRRRFLAGASAVAATAALTAFPAIRVRAARRLKVATYGGYFQESFDKHVYPEFTKATGIEVESIPEPTSEAWVTQLDAAAKAGAAPADVSMISQVGMLRGQESKLWTPLDRKRLGNIKYLPAHHIHKYSNGSVDGIGAVSWYITLVTNTKVYPEPPESWAAFWDPSNKGKLGLLSEPANSFLLEITAATFFGGKDILKTKEGVIEVMRKLAEVKPNVQLWYRDESRFLQALEAGEIPMGQYYHDVTGISASQGNPVRSTFPKEGGVLDSGCWALTRASRKVDEAHVFIEYMTQPAIQSHLARRLGTAPTVERKYTDLDDAEFAAVSSDIPPTIPEYRLYGDMGEWTSRKWSEMITS